MRFYHPNIGLPRFQASIPLWIIRLDSQSDGKNTSSYAILFEIPPAGMLLRHVPYKYLGPVDTYPDIFESATFYLRIQTFSRQRIASP